MTPAKQTNAKRELCIECGAQPAHQWLEYCIDCFAKNFGPLCPECGWRPVYKPYGICTDCWNEHYQKAQGDPKEPMNLPDGAVVMLQVDQDVQWHTWSIDVPGLPVSVEVQWDSNLGRRILIRGVESVRSREDFRRIWPAVRDAKRWSPAGRPRGGGRLTDEEFAEAFPRAWGEMKAESGGKRPKVTGAIGVATRLGLGKTQFYEYRDRYIKAGNPLPE